VNPHFLYNALESISSLANQRRWEDIRGVVQRMAGIFRYCISGSPHETVRIADELAHVRDYLAIQQLRFGERIAVTWQVDEEVVPLPCVKLLLQPLVENALSHGLADRVDGAAIWIRGRLEGDVVVLEVEDNGCGIPGAALVRLRESLESAAEHPLESPGSIGLHNVQARVRLAHGPRFGISVESSEGAGTRVAVRLPRGEAVRDAAPVAIRATLGI
jgi:two-component system sensor histidine kinase YesM